MNVHKSAIQSDNTASMRVALDELDVPRDPWQASARSIQAFGSEGYPVHATTHSHALPANFWVLVCVSSRGEDVPTRNGMSVEHEAQECAFVNLVCPTPIEVPSRGSRMSVVPFA